jgi:hypothetical protein
VSATTIAVWSMPRNDAAAGAALAFDAGADLAALVRDLLAEQVLVSVPFRVRPLGAASK